jgi:hypothetical protein
LAEGSLDDAGVALGNDDGQDFADEREETGTSGDIARGIAGEVLDVATDCREVALGLTTMGTSGLENEGHDCAAGELGGVIMTVVLLAFGQVSCGERADVRERVGGRERGGGGALDISENRSRCGIGKRPVDKHIGLALGRGVGEV